MDSGTKKEWNCEAERGPELLVKTSKVGLQSGGSFCSHCFVQLHGWRQELQLSVITRARSHVGPSSWCPTTVIVEREVAKTQPRGRESWVSWSNSSRWRQHDLSSKNAWCRKSRTQVCATVLRFVDCDFAVVLPLLLCGVSFHAVGGVQQLSCENAKILLEKEWPRLSNCCCTNLVLPTKGILNSREFVKQKNWCCCLFAILDASWPEPKKSLIFPCQVTEGEDPRCSLSDPVKTQPTDPDGTSLRLMRSASQVGFCW